MVGEVPEGGVWEEGVPGRPSVFIPPETIEEMRKLREQGVSEAALVNKYKLSKYLVHKHVGDITPAVPPRKVFADEGEIDSAIEKTALTAHGAKMVADVKEKEAVIIKSGTGAVRQFERRNLPSSILSKINDDEAASLMAYLQNVENTLGMLPKKSSGEPLTTREMMEYNIVTLQMALLQRSMPGMLGQGQSDDKLEKLIAENEKQRQFYEDKLKEQDAKLRELVFEKKLSNMEEKQDALLSSLGSLENNIGEKINLIKSAPGTAEEKKDAISQLEDFGGQVERVKKALSPLGIQVGPQAPGADPYSSVDPQMRYFVDKVDGVVKTVAGAWEKKTPDRKEVRETPSPSEPPLAPGMSRVRFIDKGTLKEVDMTPEQFYDYLSSQPKLTPAQEAWLQEYEARFVKYQPNPRLQPNPRVQQPAPPERKLEPARQEPTPEMAAVKCSLCGQGEIYQNGLCEKCWDELNRPEPAQEGATNSAGEEKKTSPIEKLKAQEEEEIKRKRELGL